MSTFGVHIDGQALDKDGEETPIYSPVDGKPWAVAKSSLDLLNKALDASRRAKEKGEWAATDASQRARVLWRFADLVEQNGPRFAELEVLASGKTLRVTQREAERAAAWYRFFAGAADKIYGAHAMLGKTTEAKILHEPVGLVAAITPSNGPLSLGSWKMAPALATGNVVLVKPPIEAPGSTLLLAELAAAAGLPAGTLNVVPGAGDIGEALVASDAVDMVTFTGSTAVARKLAGSVGSGFKRFVCEAGGKSAQIIFDDANIDDAIVQARQGVFSNAGQSCVAGSRLIVHRSIYDDFVARLAERSVGLRVGDPFDSKTHIGPVSSRVQLQRVKDHVERAKAQGAKVVIGGCPPEVDERISGGYYYRPTILTGVTTESAIWNNEVFGPVVLIVPFDEEEEAVALSNATSYGLAASLWTRDVGRAQRVARQLQAGTVWVNTYRIMNYRVPFGGYKESGLGRENGLEALYEFLNVKTVISEEAPPVDAFAF
jgi:(Z)-2-((N-methylformamido)methylene)-5-hydroxybutyrolactone dehydrogenase